MSACSYIKSIKGGIIIVNFEKITDQLPNTMRFVSSVCTSTMTTTIYYYYNNNNVSVYRHKTSICTSNTNISYNDIVNELCNNLNLDGEYYILELNNGGQNMLQISRFDPNTPVSNSVLLLTLQENHDLDAYDQTMIRYIEVGIVSGHINNTTALSHIYAKQLNDNADINAVGWDDHIMAAEKDILVKQLYDSWHSRNNIAQMHIYNLTEQLKQLNDYHILLTGSGSTGNSDAETENIQTQENSPDVILVD
uniref:Uncharacterized protein n=1 Tax=viral metagenome TaxID=1070528 RepID=A0A6C0E894_9ZZZZ